MFKHTIWAYVNNVSLYYTRSLFILLVKSLKNHCGYVRDVVSVFGRGGKLYAIVAEGDAAAEGGASRRRKRRGGGGLGEGCPLPQKNFCM